MIPANEMIGANADCLACLHEAGERLFESGWAVLANAIPADLLCALRQELAEHDAAGGFYQAGIGRGVAAQVMPQVRGDRIAWLTPQWPAAAAYLRLMAALQQHLNALGFLGLAEIEAHYAIYDAGSFYRRHTDQRRDDHAPVSGRRVVSTVTYLNDAPWPLDGGGELILYPAQQPSIQIRPEAGQLVLFWSEHMAHEVLPARLPRRSIAGWMRTRDNELPR